MIKHIAFSGGGIFGISFIGIIKALEEYKLMDNITKWHWRALMFTRRYLSKYYSLFQYFLVSLYLILCYIYLNCKLL